MNTSFDPWALASTLSAQIRALLGDHAYLVRPLARKAGALIRALEATLRRALFIMAADIKIDPAKIRKPTQKDASAPQKSAPPKPAQARIPGFQLIEANPAFTALRPFGPLPAFAGKFASAAISAAPVSILRARLERAMQVMEDKEAYAHRLAKWQARQRIRQAPRTSPLRLSVMPIPKWFDPELRHDLIQLELSIWRHTEGINSS